MPKPLILTLLLFFSALTLVAENRSWTDIEGRVLEAELIEEKGDSIVVRRKADQREFTIPLERLSEADILYLDSLSAGISIDDTMAETAFPEDGLEWPTKVSAPDDFEVEIIKEDSKDNIYIYRTNNFEFVSDIKLARKVVRDFAEVFETTLAAVQAMPLEWNIEIPEDGFKTRLFKTRDAYIAAGGIEGSGGLYSSRSRQILVPLDSLGTEKSSSGVTLGDGDQATLIHEITHQVQHDWLGKMPTWLIEGMAEYTEAIPYERGQFRFNRQDAEAFVRQDGRYPDKIPLIDLQKLMQITGREWLSNFQTNSYDVGRFYHSAFLLTYYFIHLDGDGDGKRMWNYLRALESAENQDDVIRAEQILLGPRSYHELLADMKKKYRSEGIKLQVF
ncbi:hypothetical protein [Rubellicoccus peritrichatus]|uniref:DUF1570 domain-containing protein n=1 Tax=Rubellicoccus peritrichatus TaxID=3080537 RepID=A0AAQ3QXZ4_9BACT|nr:hypothetical protein [Puniceicoccus sp. CR14]WOO43562.1 hypothetical protein RZN69_10725 [Puniceicoccus sp. CR14]